MKVVQDKLRNGQALLVSGLIILMFTSLFLFTIYEQRVAAASEGVNRLQAHIMNIFNGNEPIADAIGECYHHIINDEQYDDMPRLVPRNDQGWGINADPKRLRSVTGTMVAQQTSHSALCMYTAAEFIRGMVNELDPSSFDAHRCIVARSPDYFYRFMASGSRNFSSSNSEMARDITQFFYPPVDFHTQLLQKNVKNRVLDSTNSYTGKTTGEKAYSVTSYICDLSGKEISDQIVAYLVYDHSRSELQEALAQTLGCQVPPELDVELVDLTNNESLCLSSRCTGQSRFMMRNLSEKYALYYLLSSDRFVTCDTHAGTVILLTSFFFIIVSFSLKSRPNESDLKVYIDTLTGCFNRRVLDIIKRRGLPHCLVVLFDCNKSGTVNGTWGRAAGDHTLQIIANRMPSDIRASHGIVIHIGGDEFMILLFRPQATGAIAITQRISGQVISHAFVVDGHAVSLSISWGIVEMNGEFDVAIQNADNAMYRMKYIEGG